MWFQGLSHRNILLKCLLSAEAQCPANTVVLIHWCKNSPIIRWATLPWLVLSRKYLSSKNSPSNLEIFIQHIYRACWKVPRCGTIDIDNRHVNLDNAVIQHVKVDMLYYIMNLSIYIWVQKWPLKGCNSLHSGDRAL
jgi:hypothetical protein